jgi:hypothetical protein
MDWVGVEPTTPAMPAFQDCPALYYSFYLKIRGIERITLLVKSRSSTFFLPRWSIACTFKQSFEKKHKNSIKFDYLAGSRPSEVLESSRLINDMEKSSRCTSSDNDELTN